MTRFADSDLTQNDFLGGALQMWQPINGYRAGVDPVLLAAAVPARQGQSVLELGCGAGAAILCLGRRVPGLTRPGVELQSDYAELARRNAALNTLPMQVVHTDLTALPTDLRQIQFDHILANPPYFAKDAHTPAKDTGRSIALGETETPLDHWFDTAARRLKPRGFLHMIQRSARLPEMLASCSDRLGAVEVLPLAARTGRAPDLVILRARKGGRAAFRLHAPLIMHEGDAHLADGESYRPEIAQVLRCGAALPWPA
jgi:tRNA1(Val) A37 N6-methylase TrmN6